MDNLTLYDQFRNVPAEAKKVITGGRLNGKTDINPMWRIKALTEAFGPCGIGWWYEITDKHIERTDTGEISAFVDINLYYDLNGVVSKPIQGTGGSAFIAREKSGLYVSDECYKMALTDAISVACKALGVGADVYWDKDKTKYSTRDEASEQPQQERKDSPRCDVCGSPISATAANSVQQIINGTRKNTGKQMCTACYKAWRKEQQSEAAAVNAADSMRSESQNDDAGDRQ